MTVVAKIVDFQGGRWFVSGLLQLFFTVPPVVDKGTKYRKIVKKTSISLWIEGYSSLPVDFDLKSKASHR